VNRTVPTFVIIIERPFGKGVASSDIIERNHVQGATTQRKNSCWWKEGVVRAITFNGSKRVGRNERCEMLRQAVEGLSDFFHHQLCFESGFNQVMRIHTNSI
jgi:hypothetical protein